MVREPVLKIHFMKESKYREQSDGDIPVTLSISWEVL